MAVSSIYKIMGLPDPNKQPVTTPATNGTGAPALTAPATNPASASPLPTIAPGQTATLAPAPKLTAAGVNGVSGNQAEMIAATQNQALNPTQSPTAQAVSDLTQSYLQNPNLGFNPTNYVQGGMDTDARNRAGAMDAWQQKTAEQSNLGSRDRAFQQLALQSAQERGDLGKTLSNEANDISQKNLAQALGIGTTTAGMEEGINNQNFQNLVSAGNLGQQGEQLSTTKSENALDRTQQLLVQGNDQQGQKDLAELQGKIATGQLLTQEDFTATQNSLDRLKEKYIADGNWASAAEITTLQGDIAAKAQTAQQTWATTERNATQSWETGERMSTQDFTAATAAIKQGYDLAIQNNDLTAKDKWTTASNQLQLTMQMQGFDHDSKMKYLDAELATAKANGDVGRQKDIMDYGAKIQYAADEQKYGHETAMLNLKNTFDTALQKGEFDHADVIQKNLFDFTAGQNAQDRTIKMAETALTAKGMNLTYIENAITNGQLSPENALSALNGLMKDSGITLTAPDPTAFKSATDAQYNSLQYSYSKSHPDQVNADGTLNAAGVKGFNDYMNTNQGQTSSDTTKIADILDGTTTSTALKDKKVGDSTYDAILATTNGDLFKNPSTVVNGKTVYTPNMSNITVAGTGLFGAGDKSYTFKSVPTVDSYIKGPDGKLYQVKSDAINYNGKNIDTNYYKVLDVSTGTTAYMTPVQWTNKTAQPGAAIVTSIGQIDTQ